MLAEVFRLEGMNPDEHLTWKRQIRKRFIDLFGSISVDQESFRQGDNASLNVEQNVAGVSGFRLSVGPEPNARSA